MKVSREKAAENRERIIDAAGTLFRAKGFAGIGVADIMKAAELTHGGFYGHFASKDDLAAQASRRSLARAAAKWERIAAAAPPKKAYAALLANYLTPTHRDDPGRGCAFASLSADAARGGKTVRAAFAEGLQPFLDVLAASIPGRSTAARRRKAVATMASLVGAITLARAVGDPRLSDEILAAMQRELLETVAS
jgi:TetR/AcrR family transcriptional repressor of nem operon